MNIPDIRRTYLTYVCDAGFHSDLNETYPVGRVDEDSQRLMRTAHKCLYEAIKACKPGALIRDLGKVM